MAKVIFGVWHDKVIDNRGKLIFEIEESEELGGFDEFNPGNPIRAFFGADGFFIFDRDVSLLDAALQYTECAARESCGKCTPCRVGTQIIKSKLALLCEGKGTPAMLDEIETIAEHVHTTSLCGLGQTFPVPILKMISLLRKELSDEIDSQTVQPRQPCSTYVTSPCIEACPSKVKVPEYIDYIKNGKFSHSIGVILQEYPMAATCGRVCVRFCEMACRRTQVDEAVGIKILKRFVADRERYVTDSWFSRDLISDPKPEELKVAVIGSGPAGISAAYHLLLNGFSVDVFEAFESPGGMADRGIPTYRLPKDILRKEISIIESLGGRILYNQRMGRNFGLPELNDWGYRAVFIGIGAQQGKKLGIPGEDEELEGYHYGVTFLLHVNHDYVNRGIDLKLGRRMVVIGGGNVAMDCVRSALRLGVEEVHLVYRRSRKEMPADPEEIEAAEKEGVIFHFLTHPRRTISENGHVTGLELIEMALGEPDEDGRRSVSPIEGSEFILETDAVVPAIGQQVDHRFVNPEDGVTFDRWGMIEVDPNTLMTGHRGVFAGGDCVTGPATVVQAMAQGHKAACAIEGYLTSGRVRFSPDDRMSALIADLPENGRCSVKIPVKPEYRVKAQELDPEVRKGIFEEVEKPITKEQAYREASRCMRCYRIYSVITES